jgi:hypothetical protein
MSQLDQAKKEAKRLFNLAKANPTNHLTIPNLSASRELMATINGYQDWHEYEEILKRKDFLYGNVDKNKINRDNKEILERQQYYIQDLDFNDIEYTKKSMPVVVKKDHIPIVLGEQRETKRFDKKKSWLLDSYPVMVLGSTGAGKTENLLSMSKGFLDNKEGVIYFDGKGDNILYEKFFSYAQSLGRINDLYCINFMVGAKDVFGRIEKKISHSIDPINPMLGDIEYFKKFFGKEFGVVLHAILKHIHQKSHLMDIPSLEASMMLNNLIQWANDKFKDVSELKDYLTFLNISNEYTDGDLEQALETHAFCCETAYKTLHIFKLYKHIFKFDCSVDMEDIFLKRQILVVLMPALERSPEELSLVGDLVLAQVTYVEDKLKSYKIHTQNIIVDEFYYFAHELEEINFNETYNNYIFGTQDLCYYNTSLTNYLTLNTNTFIYMKTEGPNVFPNKIKLDIFDNIKELPLKGFKRPMQLSELFHYLREQNAGQAVVFCNNKNKKDINYINSEYSYYISPIICRYVSTGRVKEIYLVDHEKNYIFKK